MSVQPHLAELRTIWMPDPYALPGEESVVAFRAVESMLGSSILGDPPPPPPVWAEDALWASDGDALIAQAGSPESSYRLLEPGSGGGLAPGTRALVVSDETISFATALRETMDEHGFDVVEGGSNLLTGSVSAVGGELRGVYAQVDRWCRFRSDVEAISAPAGSDVLVAVLVVPQGASVTTQTERELVERHLLVLAAAAACDLVWSEETDQWMPSPFAGSDPAAAVLVCREESGAFDFMMLEARQFAATRHALQLLATNHSDEEIADRRAALPAARRRWLRQWERSAGEQPVHGIHATLCALEVPGRWHGPRSRRVRAARRSLRRLHDTRPKAAQALDSEFLSLLPPLAAGALSQTLAQIEDAAARVQTA